jgi:hypothetical protein
VNNSAGDGGEPGSFSAPLKSDNYADNREPGDWKTRYESGARRSINIEAGILISLLFLLVGISGFLLALSGQNLDFPLSSLTGLGASGSAVTPSLHINISFLLTFIIGCLGGTMFSIKWLIHAVAKCKWHLDRRYWRLFVPIMGGVYACVLLSLLDGGIVGSQNSANGRTLSLTLAYAFMVGYFSDGVSGLLSNMANAVFGTIDKR